MTDEDEKPTEDKPDPNLESLDTREGPTKDIEHK